MTFVVDAAKSMIWSETPQW